VVLVEHEQIERQDFQLEIGRIGPERTGGGCGRFRSLP
jgi:hypothetical protein